MGFNRDNNSGGRGDYGNRSYGGGSSDRQDRETFKATCASCGKECDLPFKPTGARPVYCRDCFKKNSPQDSGGDRGRDSSRDSRRGFNDRQMFNAVCDNCGDKCQLPFMPREGKEVLCSKCFEEKGGDPRKNNGQSAQQIAELNAKLDKILELLGEKPAAKVETKPKAAKPVEVETKEEKPEIELSADNTVEMQEIVIEEKPKAKKTSKK